VFEDYSPSFGAYAKVYSVSQAEARLCVRMPARFYLAVHHAVVVAALAWLLVGVIQSLLNEQAGCTVDFLGAYPFPGRLCGTSNSCDRCGNVFGSVRIFCQSCRLCTRAAIPHSPLTSRARAYCCFNQSAKTAPGFLAPPSAMISAAFSMSFCGLNRRQAIL
jgi:hypothetical protein